MAHESDPPLEINSPSRSGLYHCKIGQETVHDIVAKTTELFNHLKTTNSALQRTAENEAKRGKIRDILSSIKYMFGNLRRHYNNVNEICSSFAYVQVKSLIPYKDDPGNVEQIQKHRKILCPGPHTDSAVERRDLVKEVADKDEELKQITNELRDFIYEINTMLHISKS